MTQVAVGGYLRLNDEGLVGTLQMGAGVGASTFGFDLFAISGTFQMEVNLTNNIQTIQTLDISEYGVISGFKEGTIDPWTARVIFCGNLTLFELLLIQGRMEMTISETGLEIDMDMILDLSLMGEINIEGAAGILFTDNGPVFAMSVDASVNLGIPQVGIFADASVQINTGQEAY